MEIFRKYSKVQYPQNLLKDFCDVYKFIITTLFTMHDH